MTERPSKHMLQCEVHGVMYREGEQCARCTDGDPPSTPRVSGAVSAASAVAEPGRGFPIVPLLALVVVVAIGAVIMGQIRSKGPDASGAAVAPEAVAPLNPLTTRFEPQLREIESALFEGRLDGYQLWNSAETGVMQIVEGLRDARTLAERQALIHLTAFVANSGNRVELGGMDITDLQRNWVETRTAVFGSAPWFKPSPGAAESPGAGAYFYPDRGEPVDAARVQVLRDWFEEARRLAGVGQDQARRISEIGPEGDSPGSNAAAQTLSNWRNWVQRWENSLAGIERAAPPLPMTDGAGVAEYLEIHQSVLETVARLRAIRYETGTYGVPNRDHRLAFFTSSQGRLNDAVPLLRSLSESLR